MVRVKMIKSIIIFHLHEDRHEGRKGHRQPAQIKKGRHLESAKNAQEISVYRMHRKSITGIKNEDERGRNSIRPSHRRSMRLISALYSQFVRRKD